MARVLKQSTSITLRIGPFVDSGDGVTVEDSLTISQADIRLSKAGGDFAQSNDTGGATHDENGWYSLTLDATDTNTCGILTVMVNETGALPVWEHFQVVASNVYDSLYAAATTDYLQVDITQCGGSTVAAGAIPNAAAAANGGLPTVNASNYVAGIVGTNNNTLDDIADASGRVDVGAWLGTAVTTSSTTNKPQVDVDSIDDDATAADNAEAFFDGTGYAGTNNVIPTVTTLTGHTAQTGDSYARLGAPIGASISADIQTVDGNVDSILTDTGTDGVVVADGAITSAKFGAGAITASVIATDAVDADALAADALAEINAQVDDVISTDTQTLPGQGTPSNTPTIVQMIMYLYKAWKNKWDNDGSTMQLYDNAGSTVDQKASVSESGGTVTKGAIATGP